MFSIIASAYCGHLEFRSPFSRCSGGEAGGDGRPGCRAPLLSPPFIFGRLPPTLAEVYRINQSSETTDLQSQPWLIADCLMTYHGVCG